MSGPSPSLAKPSSIPVLLVMAGERQHIILPQLEACKFHTITARNYREASSVLQSEPAIRVVVTDLGLADGDWYEVLTAVERYEVPAQVVVVFTGAVDRHYIDQHMDILESGAYDVLAEPSQRAAVRAVIESAAAHSLRRFAAAAGRL